MTGPRVAVLMRTHFWDEFAFRAATRLWHQSEGADFYIEVNESESGPVDVAPFRKIRHTLEGYEAMGLPCAAPPGRPPLWWNADYGLYGAALQLPDYDYYFLIEYDVAVNARLRPIVDRVAAAGIECVTCYEANPMRDTWAHAASCEGLPYARKAWVPVCVMLASRRVALHLLAERRRCAALYAEGRLGGWPISEGFFASALATAGIVTGSLRKFAELPHFGTESIYLEADPLTRSPGSFSHAVLDPDRFWDKFASRAVRTWLGRGEYAPLRHAREQLARIGRIAHGGWRIASAERSLALDRPARQSSLSNWSRRGRADAADPTALDARGANCGVLTGSYAFHTGHEDSPWWAVDLGRECGVEEVRITNGRQAPERARRLVVQASDDGAAWRDLFRKTDDRVFAGNDDPLVCRLASPARARHVRVVLDGPGLLHLAQVEVFGSAGA